MKTNSQVFIIRLSIIKNLAQKEKRSMYAWRLVGASSAVRAPIYSLDSFEENKRWSQLDKNWGLVQLIIPNLKSETETIPMLFVESKIFSDFFDIEKEEILVCY